MKKLACVLAAIFLVGLTAGCNNKSESAASKNESFKTFVETSLDRAVTNGNHTYIPFGMTYPRDHISEILAILNQFETRHPDLKITNWNIDVGEYTTHGLWIDHEPRTN